MPTELFLLYAKGSLTTAIVAALLLLLTPLLKRRYPANWRYVAWLIVALRLIIPFNVSLPQAPVQIAVPSAVAVAPQPANPVPAADVWEADNDAPLTDGTSGFGSSASAPAKSEAIDPAGLAAAIWIAGMLVFFALQAATYLRFLRRLHFSPHGEAPDAMRAQWELACRDSGLARAPEIVINAGVPAPVLTGLFRSRLLLPHDRYANREIQFIFRHELVHYRRRDLCYKLILMIANGIHWFNPLVYAAVAQANRDVELSCDDAVMAGLGNADRAEYGEAILNALPVKKEWRLEPVFTTSFGSTKKTMKQRLVNLFDRTIKKRGIAALCAVILVAATVGGMVAFNPMMATAGTESTTESKHDSTFSFDSVAANDAVCIGRIELKKGVSYNLDVSVWEGTQWAVGLNKAGNISGYNSDGVAWNQYYGTSTEKRIQASFSDRREGSYYVYVMSTGTQLRGIKGTLSTDDPDGSITGMPLAESSASFDVVRFSASDGKRVSFGPYALTKGTQYSVTMSWDEGGSRPLSCIQNTSNGSEPIGQYTITSGIPLTLTVAESGNCRFVVTSGQPQMTNLSFSVTPQLSSTSTADGSMRTASIGEDIWYLVETEAQLRSIGQNDEALSRKYMQNADITVTSVWTPIGSDAHPFTGIYNGNGFAIRGLQYKDDEKRRGLFGYAEYADLENITIVGLGTGPVAAISLDGELTDSGVVSEAEYLAAVKARQNALQTVSFTNVELRRYSSGSPYIHDIISNNTNKRMMTNEICMLAFDKDGNPLKLRWNYLSSSTSPQFSFLYDWGGDEIAPGKNNDDEDNTGGWSLFSNTGDTPAEVEKVAYILYTFRSITFADGTVWINPDYENWLKTYEGQTASVESLKNYYPHTVAIDK